MVDIAAEQDERHTEEGRMVVAAASVAGDATARVRP